MLKALCTLLVLVYDLCITCVRLVYDLCITCVWASHTHQQKSAPFSKVIKSSVFCMSHVSRLNESCLTYGWIMSRIRMKIRAIFQRDQIICVLYEHVSRMNESCLTYEWVMSHIRWVSWHESYVPWLVECKILLIHTCGLYYCWSYSWLFYSCSSCSLLVLFLLIRIHVTAAHPHSCIWHGSCHDEWCLISDMSHVLYRHVSYHVTMSHVSCVWHGSCHDESCLISDDIYVIHTNDYDTNMDESRHTIHHFIHTNQDLRHTVNPDEQLMSSIKKKVNMMDRKK